MSTFDSLTSKYYTSKMDGKRTNDEMDGERETRRDEAEDGRASRPPIPRRLTIEQRRTHTDLAGRRSGSGSQEARDGACVDVDVGTTATLRRTVLLLLRREAREPKGGIQRV